MNERESQLRAFLQELVDRKPEPPPEDWEMDGKEEAIWGSEHVTRIEIADRAERLLKRLYPE